MVHCVQKKVAEQSPSTEAVAAQTGGIAGSVQRVVVKKAFG